MCIIIIQAIIGMRGFINGIIIGYYWNGIVVVEQTRNEISRFSPPHMSIPMS